jgi:membrane associated rhomboid family serine protease
MTGGLIAINVLIHLARQLLPMRLDERLVDALGFNTATLGHFDGMAALSLLTYQFLHEGWDHLVINMVSLLAFGAGVERPLGPIRFLILYFLAGVAGALVEALVTPSGANDLLIGASASISGLFGALVVIWGIHRRGRRPLGLVRLILVWSVLMAVTGILGVGANGSPVAWVAHIGGFVAGIGLAVVFRVTATPEQA